MTPVLGVTVEVTQGMMVGKVRVITTEWWGR